MANRYKAAENRPRVTPGGNKPTVPAEEAPVVPVVEEPTPVTATPEAPAAEPVVTTDFLASKIEPKQEGKTVGFYLSNEAIKKIDKLAKQLKCSKSKALDTLIREIIE